MVQKHFYIFRHGLTDYNVLGRVQGQGCDIPLNQTGREQAAKLAAELADVKLDVVFTSPLKRAYETGKIVADNKNCALIKTESLQECHFGIAEGKLRAEINPEDYEKHRGVSPGFKFEGGETQRDAAERALMELKNIAAHTDYENIGISTHGGIMRFLLSYFWDIPTEMGIENAKPYHFTYENGKFDILNF